jgi:hypothetical protein
MRTTLDIDADVLAAVRALALSADSTAGRLISDVMRRAIALGLAHANAPATAHKMPMPKAVYGFSPLTSGGSIVTNDMVRAIRDGLGD